MNLIQPAEISGKIMTLIDQAKNEFIIVSPYNKLGNWKKLTQRIEKAKERGVIIKWYIRKNVKENNIEQIIKLGIIPIEIENLHCKMYLNEKAAIVTSMNLHEYSDSSSIDIGYLITEKEKHHEILEFIEMHIDSSITKESIVPVKSEIKGSYYDLLIGYLQKHISTCKEITVRRNSFGNIVTLEEFCGQYELVLEPKGYYYRIDLKIKGPYNQRFRIFNILKSKNETFQKEYGEEISFGSEMLRLKIDLTIFENYNYSSWGINELNILKPRLDKIIAMYLKELNYTV